MAKSFPPNSPPSRVPLPVWIGISILAVVVLALGFNLRIQKTRADESKMQATRAAERAERALKAAAQSLAAAKEAKEIAQHKANIFKSTEKDFVESTRAAATAAATAAQKQTDKKIDELERAVEAAIKDTKRAFQTQTASESQSQAFITRLQFNHAEKAFDEDDSSRGLAILADIVRNYPQDRVAAARLLSALTYRNFTLPLQKPFPVSPNTETISFSPDGMFVAAIATDPPGETAVQIWSVEPGVPPLPPLVHSNRIEHLEFSPDGKRLIVSANEQRKIQEGGRAAIIPVKGAAWIWNAFNAKLVAGPLAHDIGVWSASFNPAGNRALTVGGDRTARVWDAATGAPTAQPLKHPSPIFRAAFSPDGSLIMTVSDKAIYTWNAQSGDGPLLTLQFAGNILAAQFTIDSKLIVAFSSDDRTSVWNSRTGALQLSAPFPLPNIAPNAGSVISPDGQRIAAAYSRGGAAIWDAFSGQAIADDLYHDLPVARVRFGPNGRLLATTALDGSARLWDAHASAPITEPLRNLVYPMRLKFSPRGDRIAVLQTGAGAEVRSILPGAAKPLMLLANDPLFTASYSPDGSKVVAKDGNDVRFVWDVRTGRRASLAVDPATAVERSYLARATNGNTVIIENNIDDKTRFLTLDRKLVSGLRSVVLSSDGALLIAIMDGRETDIKGSLAGGATQVFNAETGKALTPRQVHPNPIASAKFSADGSLIATTCADRSVRLFEIGETPRSFAPLKHADPVIKADFSPDGSRLLTQSTENDLRVWDVSSGQPLSETKRQWGKILKLEFNPASDQILILTEAGLVELWDVPISPDSAPDWLPTLAEAVAGQINDGTGARQPGRHESALYFEIKTGLEQSVAADFYTRWGKWFVADRASRAISPFNEMPVDQYVRALIDENSFDSILQAVALDPANARALARLALLTIDEPAEDNIRRIGEADFYSLRALQLDPRSSEVIRIREIIAAALKQKQEQPKGN